MAFFVRWIGDVVVCVAFAVDIEAAVEVDWSNGLALVDAGVAECCCVTPENERIK